MEKESESKWKNSVAAERLECIKLKKDKIGNSTRSKRRFKASVSHEIEVPLYNVLVSLVLSVTVFPLFLLFQGMLIEQAERVPESMYKHLQTLDLHHVAFSHSQIKSTRDQAYILVKAAMAGSGVFDLNFAERGQKVFE
jgi:hypothetical protein